jgi:hypothetical protein
MSNYRAPAFNPETGRIEEADWLDNHFGDHAYGVSFGGKVYHAHEVSWDAVGAEIERLRARPSPSEDVARLEAEVAAKDRTIAQLELIYNKRREWGEAQQKRALAAESDAARLREALTAITKIENEEFGPDWDEIERARDIARAALIGTGDGWREIESAPKDGTDVLLWRGKYPPLVAGWFSNGETSGWSSFDDENRWIDFDLTHWRPLPSPPSGRETKTGDA